MTSLEKLWGLLAKRNSVEPPWSKRDVTDEVSDHDGTLLVRLGRGSAMQVRVEADSNTVLYRIVPIANVMRMEIEAAWRRATDNQVTAWLCDGSAIGGWLLTKGLRCGPRIGQFAAAS